MHVFGPFRLDVRERTLQRSGVPVDLQDKAFDLLVALVERPGALIPRDELQARLWPGVIVTEQSLRHAVRRLRSALDDTDGTMLENVRGHGYRLLTDVAAVGRPHTPWGTRFVGRAADLVALGPLSKQPGVVTLLGPGGVGKSRLAAEVARAVDLVFCALNDVRTVEGTYAAVAEALGVVLPYDEPDRAVAAALARRAGVVLDGVEHLIEALAPMVARWRSLAPGATILVTSREPLRIDGEHRYVVGPLPVASDGVELLLDRAGLVSDGRIDLRDAVTVVQRLDGLPLAIELAAARLVAMSVSELATGLDRRFALLTTGARGAPSRHATLEAVFDWSWDLLDADERSIVGQCSVFEGPFSMDVAEDVVRSSRPVVDGLLALVEKSWLQVEDRTPQTRYRMLETVRAYATERADVGEARARHARAHARIGDPRRTADRPRPDTLGDLLAAVRWGLDHADPEVVIGATLGAALLLEARGPLTAAVEWLDRALGLLPDDPRLLYLSARVRARAGDPGEAVRRCERAATLARARGDTATELDALRLRCGVLRMGPRDAAMDAHRVALARARELRDRSAEAVLVGQRSRLEIRAGQFETALGSAREGLALARACGDPLAQHRLLADLAAVLYRMGRYEEAHGHLVEAKRFVPFPEPVIHNDLALALQVLGRPDEAAVELEQAIETLLSRGDQLHVTRLLVNLGSVRLDQGRPAEGLELFRRAHEVALAIGDGEGRALALVNIVQCARAELGPVETAAHLDEALAQARSVGSRWLEDVIVLERDGGLSPSGSRG